MCNVAAMIKKFVVFTRHKILFSKQKYIFYNTNNYKINFLGCIKFFPSDDKHVYRIGWGS